MRSFCLLIAVVWAVVPAAGGQAAYYIERNGILQPVVKGNPEREHADEWRIRLYKQGAPQSGPGWGQILGQSADDAREELERSREFQERLLRFCETASPNESAAAAYANALGPIAVYEEAKPMNARAKPTDKGESDRPQNEAFDLADRISELENQFLAVTEEKQVQAHPSRYPFAASSPPWAFAIKLAETKREFERSNALASAGGPSSREMSDAHMKIKDALTDLEARLLPPMRKALANLSLEGTWRHRGITYVSVRNGRQLSLKADTPDGLRFRNISIDSDTTLNGEIEFVYDNGCEPVWARFTAELTFDGDAQGILLSAPRVGREKSTCREVTQGTLRMMFWRPGQ